MPCKKNFLKLFCHERTLKQNKMEETKSNITQGKVLFSLGNNIQSSTIIVMGLLLNYEILVNLRRYQPNYNILMIFASTTIVIHIQKW